MQEVVVTLLHYDIHPTLCFLSGDECELIGGRQGHVWRCGPPRELHAGQWVHSDEGIGRAQPQQSDLYPPPQPEASDGIRSASLPRWVETQDNKRHTCAYERHILEDMQGWEMTLLSPSNWKKGWPGRSSLDLVVGGLKCEMCILKKLEIQSAAQSLLSSCKMNKYTKPLFWHYIKIFNTRSITRVFLPGLQILWWCDLWSFALTFILLPFYLRMKTEFSTAAPGQTS